jgi:hypothetical protein
MLLTTQHICVSTGTASKGNLVRLGHFNWHAGVLSHRAAPVTLGVSMILSRPPQPVLRKISEGRAYRRMDSKKLGMTYDPRNSSQNAKIHRTQRLQAVGEVRILGPWKYSERYSAVGRVPVARTQSAFKLQKMRGNPPSEQRQKGAFPLSILLPDLRSAGPSSFRSSLAN